MRLDTLPANPEAERLVLGSVLLDHARNWGEVSTLGADEFHLEPHRRIYVAMSELAEKAIAIDRVTIGNALMAKGQIESVGGFSYLVSLDDGLPQVYNLDSYIAIIREKATLRKAAIRAQMLLDELLSPSASLGAISDAKTFLEALEGQKT